MIRIGQISKVDAANGMAQVVYEDQDDLTTELLPILQPFAKLITKDHTGPVEHKHQIMFDPPEVGEFVVVGHTNNNPSRGVILGRYWNEANPPAEPKEGYHG
ncbi:MAG: hypothetical protein J5819_00260 [Eubacterium sp.]|nr:hypothetical protein [Eubacterium sp.]